MWKIAVFLKNYIDSVKLGLIIFISLCIFSTILSISAPFISGSFVDILVNAKNTDFLLRYSTIFISIGLLSIAMNYVTGISYSKLQSILSFKVNSDAIQHLQRLPMMSVTNLNSAYMNQRINSDANMITMFAMNTVQGIIGNILTIIIPITYIFSFDILLGAGIVFSALFYYVVYNRFKRPLFEVNKEYKEQQSSFFSRLDEQLTFIKLIKTHVLYQEFECRLIKSFKLLYEVIIKSKRLSVTFSSFDNLVTLISQIMIFIYGGLLVYYAKITIGQYTIISSYYMMIISSVKYFFSLGKNIQENLVSLYRLDEIKHACLEQNGTVRISDIQGIKITDLKFSYTDRNYICYPDMIFNKGYTYAMIGANGSGKTTFIKLIIGLYSSFTGDIQYNHISVRELDMISIRKELISVVEQDPALLIDSFYNNISLLSSYDVCKEDVNLLAKVLSVEGFEKEGYSNIVGEQTNSLSGGERQKIALIRAFAKRPDLIVLDEPTSSLDIESTRQFIKFIKSVKDDKIIIIITHDADIADQCDYKYYIT